MKGFILSLRSEFYKSRKTLGFWCAIILPFVLCTLISWGTYAHADKLKMFPPFMLWFQFARPLLDTMGTLLLPVYVIIVAYSVNSIEHKADTWKTLFSLPVPKWSVYSAKYFYTVFLVVLCLFLFAALTLCYGTLLGVIKPELKFRDYAISGLLFQIYTKFFLSALGIISIQFLMSLIWADFLKPMGIGFVCTIAGIIMAATQLKYAYLFPWSQPFMAIMSITPKHKGMMLPTGVDVNLFHKEIITSLIIAAAVFIVGFIVVQKKSVK